MRKFTLICAAILCLCGPLAAQNDTTTPASSSPAASQGPRRGFGDEAGAWQVGANFVYQRYDIGGTNSNLYGIHSSVARFIHDGSFGVEGAVSATFGYLVPGDREQLVFYGGGVKYQMRGHKIQPWAHVLVGGAHMRLNQMIGPASFNGFGLMAGGGADVRFRSHISWRFEGDYFTTLINTVWQKNISVGAGIVVTF